MTAILPRSAVRQTADETAREVATRLADPAIVAAAVAASQEQSTLTDFVRWRPHTVAGGYAGLALLCGVADARWPGEGLDRAGHRHLAAATAAAEAAAHVDSSLHSGLAGLGYAAHVLAGGRDRYRRLTATVDAALLPRVEAAAERLDAARGCGVGAFDLISGLSGTTVHLLARRADPAVARALRRVLAALANLLADRGEPRRWHTPAALSGESLRTAYPHGNHNCGLAHGVPGPLALLSVALLEGAVDDDLVEAVGGAVATAAGWLAAQRVELPEGADWPNAVGLPAPDGAPHEPDPCHPGRAAWCYGVAGVARALWLAGAALDHVGCGDVGLDGQGHRDLALRAVRAALARPPEQRYLTSPTVCHGTAGLLLVAVRFAADTGCPDLAAFVDDLTAELLGAYEPGSLLGFRDVEPGGVQVDQPALLDGAPGVALALMAAAGAEPPAWDRLFLLS
jgi:hypothetical protein